MKKEMQKLLERSKQKKGQMGLEGILTGFVIVAAVLVLVILIVFVFGVIGESLETTAQSNFVGNESGAINATGYQLAGASTTGNPRNYAIVIALNSTSNATIAANQYTLNTTSGVVTNATGTIYDAVFFSYTFSNNSAEIVAAQQAQDDTARSIPLIGILFIIIAVGAIISILIISLLGRRRA